jgi:hypothetical protein
MEPEHALHNHVKKRAEIVSAPDVTVLVKNDRVQLLWQELFQNAFR